MDRASGSCHRHRVIRPVVVDAVRTPIGAKDGGLSTWHPADLAGHLLRVLATRTGIDPADVDDVLLGCAMPVGSQGFNVARNAVLAAGWPNSVPAGTVERQGVSSFAAVAAGARAVASGMARLVIVGGVEMMSTTPAGATLVPGAMPFGPAMTARYKDIGGLVPPAAAADALGVTREEADAYALRSYAKAGADPSIVAVGSIRSDERRQPGDVSGARPLFDAEGTVTAANSAPAADGAALLLLAADSLGLEPLAQVVAVAETAVDPVAMWTAGESATGRALQLAGLKERDVDRFEVAEPFAPVAIRWLRATGVDEACVNLGGGGIALGEPTGAAGARLLATLAHAGVSTGVAVGFAVGGLGAAVVLRRP